MGKKGFMESISRKDFRSLQSIDDFWAFIKIYENKYVLKECKHNSLEYLEFLVSLNDLNIPNVLFPSEIIEIKYEDGTSRYAIKEKYLKRYNQLRSKKISKYSTKDILNIYKDLLVALKKINELGLIHYDIANRNIMVKNKYAYFFDFDCSFIFKENDLVGYNDLYKLFNSSYEKNIFDVKDTNIDLKDILINEDKALLLAILLRVLQNNSFIDLGLDRELSEKYLRKTINSLDLPKEINDKFLSYYVDRVKVDKNDYFIDELNYLIENDYNILKKKTR